MKYQTSISGIGDLALELFEETGSLVLFDDTAPPELQEISVIHQTAPLEEEVRVGDEFILAEKTYRVKKVGSEANYTLKTQGHCTLIFNPHATEFLPGQIFLEGNTPPVFSQGALLAFR